jgi:hypothetical protein
VRRLYALVSLAVAYLRVHRERAYVTSSSSGAVDDLGKQNRPRQLRKREFETRKHGCRLQDRILESVENVVVGGGYTGRYNITTRGKPRKTAALREGPGRVGTAVAQAWSLVAPLCPPPSCPATLGFVNFQNRPIRARTATGTTEFWPQVLRLCAFDSTFATFHSEVLYFPNKWPRYKVVATSQLVLDGFQPALSFIHITVFLHP